MLDSEMEKIRVDKTVEATTPKEGTTTLPESCTCEDEFVITVCPIHHKSASEVEKDVTIISDEQLISNEMGFWKGFIFMCPLCSRPGIMANSALGERCACCGREVLIRSKIVTNAIRRIEKQSVR